MDLEIAGKRALVLASSRGLGRAIAERLAREGADVIICGRSEDKLAEAAGAITALGGGTVTHTHADLADPSVVDHLEAAVKERFCALDILVNNTGGPPPGAMSEADSEVVARQFDMMVRRVMDITARFVPAMRESGWGRVLTVASSGVEQPIPNLGLSNALRSALVGWSKSMSNELAADGITFNLLLPGRIQTERVDELDAANAKRNDLSVDAVREAARKAIPAGRYGTVEEFASVAAFLVGGPASYMTGGLVRCDGGSIRSV
ncbi:SDR family oxidoreductase [Pararhizobium mangrovi]|uniref:SDR family oxidoreductase n=1 Tax=Pararhizobium mangrovi TaxID=2590452 RepID=A0A506TYA2_9HYPH|nr:SDR family oxidoreductase [Pararhizobium mangrovi]TPW25951.1 SDR family oxidoreductase [Pararhizobium mangrovi]